MRKKTVSCLLVGVMCTLIGSVAYADESGSESRADSIKSHGTLLCEQADADDEVYITSQDLISLANDVDRLEVMIDALNMKSNPNIEYIYHKHAGSQSGSGSGCYRAYHEHNSHTCKYEFEWGGPCDGDLFYTNGDGGHFVCNKCGYAGDGSPLPSSHDELLGMKWLCGDLPVTGYNIVCGKTEGVTIDSAIITFP